MKRILIVLASVVIGLVAFAKPPQLNVEKIFDGSYNYDKSVSLHISRENGKYFRGCTVRNNAALVKKITALFGKDLKRAVKSQEIINNGPSYSSMTITNNNLEIYIGLSYEPDNGCYLFINGPLDAFK
jgi:hypothetical protein